MAHEFQPAAAGEVAETSPVVGAAQAARLPHLSNPPWRYKFHPLRWMQFPDGPDGGPEWLPLLGTLQYDLGVSGIDKGGSDALARVEHDRRGWTILPWDVCPPGTPNGRYIRAFPARGGTYHCSAWETPRHIGGRVLPSVTDEAGYRAFLRWLVAEGHVPPMSADAKELLSENQKVREQEAETHEAKVKAKKGAKP